MNRIKEILKEKGISQMWLSQKIYKSYCMVNAYVCNRKQPSLDLLYKITEVLEVDPKELLNNKK